MIFAGVIVGVWYVFIMISEKNKNNNSDEENEVKEDLKSQEKDYSFSASGEKINKRTRNLIILIIIFLAIVGLTYWNYKRLDKKQQLLLKEKEKIKKELEDSNTQLMRVDIVNENLLKIEEEVFLNNKIMMKEDTPTGTLSYLFDIANKYAGFLHFDYGLSESGIKTKDSKVFYNQYILTGKAFINQIFLFLDQLERQPAFYTIESLALNIMNISEEGRVQFSIELRAYYTATGKNLANIKLRKNKVRRLSYNPFFPRIHEKVDKKDDDFLDLLDIESVDMVALSPERVFLKSRNNGIIKILNIGDRVRFGYLENIDWLRQEAVFAVNRYGVQERMRLAIK